MPAVDLFPDVTTAGSLQQALFSFPPEELEKYDRESRQLILSTLLSKAEAVQSALPSYYVNLHAHPEQVDDFHEKIGFIPVALLEQVNEEWAAEFESLEQYAAFLSVYRASNPQVALGTSS